MLFTSQLKKINIKLFPSKLIARSLLGSFRPIKTINLTQKLHHSFVNIQIDSKYYHEPLPTKINDIISLI